MDMLIGSATPLASSCCSQVYRSSVYRFCLGIRSVKVTEKHYNPWVRSRQEQLEADLERAWSRDPLVLLETEAAQPLRVL